MSFSNRVALSDVSNRMPRNGSLSLKTLSNVSSASNILSAAQQPLRHTPTHTPIGNSSLPMCLALPEPEPFTLTPNTCVPSFLHHIGMSQYAAIFMEHGVLSCSMLYSIAYETLRAYVTCEEHCQAIYSTLHAPAAPAAISSQPSMHRVISIRRNDPYLYNCLEHEGYPSTTMDMDITQVASEPSTPMVVPIEDAQLMMAQTASSMHEEMAINACEDVLAQSEPVSPLLHSLDMQFITASCDLLDEMPVPSDLPSACTCLIHFKYRQAEYSSTFIARPGQYVMVSGDRGQDLGLVLRVNTDSTKGYVERTGPQGSILRPAYQKEVDYVNGALRLDEAAATELCRLKVQRLGLNMEVHYAEYQYDKKKLTFYYESRARVDFVALLKDLYREFGCRIWMEKVPKTAGANASVSSTVVQQVSAASNS